MKDSSLDKMVPCPDEAHELDNGFNPTTQNVYGPGHHDCYICDNEGEITMKEFQEWEHDQMYARIKYNSNSKR